MKEMVIALLCAIGGLMTAVVTLFRAYQNQQRYLRELERAIIGGIEFVPDDTQANPENVGILLTSSEIRCSNEILRAIGRPQE